MKSVQLLLTVFFLQAALLAGAQNQNDSTGLPGDNLDLNAVLDIFKNSKDPQEFEKKLNSADTKVNNLDLNDDGKVDYLTVTDYGKGDSHSLVIRDNISSSESQDVAVIESEKKGDKNVNVQIVGDEDLYGKDYIITPGDSATISNNAPAKQKEVPDDVYQTPQTAQPVVYINVWSWPCVNYMYAPGYAFWASPWYWGYYPPWWSPWAPYGWWTYRSYWYPHHYWHHYHRAYANRMTAAHNAYYGHRASSGYVQKNIQKRAPANNNINNGPRRQGQTNQPGGKQPGGQIKKPVNQKPGVKTVPRPQPAQKSQPVFKPQPAPKPQQAPNRSGGRVGGGMGGGINRGSGGGHTGGGMRGGKR